MERPEAIQILKPFLDAVTSLKNESSAAIPLLRELAVLSSGVDSAGSESEAAPGPLKKRIHRRYLRLCRIQEELSRLDFKKAGAGVSPEDYVFSQIDFSRYREMDRTYFETLFLEGHEDFSEAFFRKNFNHSREEIQTLIETGCTKTEALYKIQKESPLILSVMRTLETSLETLPLFSAAEIDSELKKLPDFSGKPAAEALFPLLVTSLDGACIHHEDGMTTKLFINDDGDLAGTFRPSDKPWTLVLIPAKY